MAMLNNQRVYIYILYIYVSNWWYTYPPEKYCISQIGSSSQLLGNIKNVPNHQQYIYNIFLKARCSKYCCGLDIHIYIHSIYIYDTEFRLIMVDLHGF